ncbi:MAG: DegQ family serine endoprotease [Nitrospiraceae bacterium]|nr:DegQ family serine endoprotease [Nitrospiraceae bacterium]
MKLRKKTLIISTIFISVGIIIGIGISSNFNLLSTAHTDEQMISKDTIDLLSKIDQAMSEIASAVKPAVVNISSSKTIKQRQLAFPFDDPFLKRFFGDEFGAPNKPKERKEFGLGSGVIVDKNGYILTNSHVVQGADEIKVRLSDKREFKGKIIGADPKTDIAVVKIDANNLPVLKLGDSEKLKVGQTVIAIGNPFGLNQTVTSGIISATGRANVGITDYEDFIQTDAAINPGNSGGALVNIRGELIGINTAIFSTSGGYQGIGFAIPINMAKNVMETLIKSGKVTRGWLGVSIQPITPELAKQFNLKDDKGALVGGITEDSPAEKAGLQNGDVIIEYDGKQITDPVNLRNLVAATPPNKEVKLKILRNGNTQTISITIGELPAEQKIAGKFDNLLKGVIVQNLTSEIRQQLEIPGKVRGVVIVDFADDSISEGILGRGDVILEINKKRVTNMKEYETIVSKIKGNQDILLRIYREGSAIYLTLSVK